MCCTNWDIEDARQEPQPRGWTGKAHLSDAKKEQSVGLCHILDVRTWERVWVKDDTQITGLSDKQGGEVVRCDQRGDQQGRHALGKIKSSVSSTLGWSWQTVVYMKWQRNKPRDEAGLRRQVGSTWVDLQVSCARTGADGVFADEITQRWRKVQKEKAKRTGFCKMSTENNNASDIA